MDPFLCKNRAERFVFSTRSALFFLSVLMIYFRFLHLFFHHSLMNSILPQYRAGCLTEAFEVHSERNVMHIISVQFRFFPDRKFIPPMDLCPAGEARTDAVCAVPLPLRDQILLIPERRTRTDERHVAF